MPNALKPNNPFDNAGPMDVGFAKDFAPTSLLEATDAAIEDQAAYDKLGPLTRAAMGKSSIRWSSAKALEHIERMRGRPSDPRIDAAMARMMEQAEPGIIGKLRVGDELAVAAGEKAHLQRIVDRAMKPRQRVG